MCAECAFAETIHIGLPYGRKGSVRYLRPPELLITGQMMPPSVAASTNATLTSQLIEFRKSCDSLSNPNDRLPQARQRQSKI